MSARRPHDAYPTPASIVAAMLEHWPLYWGGPIWEPCGGCGILARELDDGGFKVVVTDINSGNDFFGFKSPEATTIITNPPFKYIREFIDHAFAIGVERMMLVCPERLWACKKGAQQFERYQPSLWANLSWREDYLGKGGSPDRALAVAIWQQPCSATTRFEVWDKPELAS